jgi:hypothetical protein
LTQLHSEAILSLVRSNGLKAFPCWPGTKKPVPVHGFQSTPEEIKAAFERVSGQDYNLAIGAGADSSGVIAVDLETEEVARQLFPKLDELLSMTWCIRSPHGGIVVLVKAADRIPQRRIRIAGEEHPFDICGEGGYFLVWGTIDHTKCDPAKVRCPHAGTSSYETISSGYQVMEMTEIEKGIVRRCAELGWKTDLRKWPRVSEVAGGTAEGSRNNAAFVMARYCRHTLGMPPSDALAALREWNKRNQPPLQDHELKAVLDSVCRYGGAGRGDLWSAIRK